MLVAWGLTLEGQKVLLGLQLGSRESYESWLDFGRDLQRRGMRAPALVIADGAPGIWKATRELWPGAIWLIVSLADQDAPDLRAFRIDGPDVEEVELKVD